jgi:adenylyl cyclase-associated protein
VYIYNCSNSSIRIHGKVNAVTLDGCNKVGLAFDNVVATVDLVNCSSCEVQAIGFVPSFAIDKCSSIQVILSETCLTAEIVSAKSDQINVILPPLNPNDDITELAVPEQFKTTVVGRTLKTVNVEHV